MRTKAMSQGAPPSGPAPLAPSEIAEAVRQYRLRRQRMRAPDPISPWRQSPPKPVVLWTDEECIAFLVFTCETVARLEGKERVMLPITDRVREWLNDARGQADLRELGSAVIEGRITLDLALAKAHRMGKQAQRTEDAETSDRN